MELSEDLLQFLCRFSHDYGIGDEMMSSLLTFKIETYSVFAQVLMKENHPVSANV